MNLALGTVQFGLNYGVANATGQVKLEEARAILNRAHEAGMDTLDTAISYGESEHILGLLGIQSWKTVTKLPGVPTDCCDLNQWIKDQVKGSQQRLGVDRLYGLLLHRPEQLLGKLGPMLYDALSNLKFEGLVEKIGVSVYGPMQLDSLFENYTFDLIQAPLNIFDRSLISSGWVSRLSDAGIEIHSRSAFLQGLLLIPANERPAKFDRWKNIWEEWDCWLKESELTPLQACMRYVNSLDGIDRVIVGVDTVEHLNEIIDGADGKLAHIPEFNLPHDLRLFNPATWGHL